MEKKTVRKHVIRPLRIAAGYERDRDLADALGISTETYYRRFREQSWTLEKRIALAHALGVSLADVEGLK
jgi:DNA-binding XRE family transcriptional regulator